MIDKPYIEDVQNLPDTRQIAINRVGIKDIRHPIMVEDKNGRTQHTIATFAMYVQLPPHIKGAHMSRFVELLNYHKDPISITQLETITGEMIKRLNAHSGYLAIQFAYFIDKQAPVSKVNSVLDYETTFMGELINEQFFLTLKVRVPVTSLCPCSKKISDYGAHNQRSHITVSVLIKELIWVEDLIMLVEQQASCELYGLLKRVDEKYVTERAYDNPKFVEDMVRDIALTLNQETRVLAYSIESENFESIHNHSAYAYIEHDKRGRT